MPNGRLAKNPNRRLYIGLECPNARLCVSSCIANDKVWFIVPPMTYAQKINFGQDESRKSMATIIWIHTDITTWIDIRQSWPINCLISGCFSNGKKQNKICTQEKKKTNNTYLEFLFVVWHVAHQYMHDRNHV